MSLLDSPRTGNYTGTLLNRIAALRGGFFLNELATRSPEHRSCIEDPMKRLALALLLTAGFAAAGDLPDARMTPGAMNPDVTQANIQQTVCVKGFTKTIRPPAYYTNKLKKNQIREYGYADTDPKHYEEDHLVALSIGGDPRDEHNLWPQPRNTEWGAEKKDQLEFVLYRAVCDGKVPLAEAQRAMATDWIAAYKKYVPNSTYKQRGHVD